MLRNLFGWLISAALMLGWWFQHSLCYSRDLLVLQRGHSCFYTLAVALQRCSVSFNIQQPRLQSLRERSESEEAASEHLGGLVPCSRAHLQYKYLGTSPANSTVSSLAHNQSLIPLTPPVRSPLDHHHKRGLGNKINGSMRDALRQLLWKGDINNI